MDITLYTLYALVGLNLGWLLFLSVQVRWALGALGHYAAEERSHRESLQRRQLEAVAQAEGAALTAIREIATALALRSAPSTPPPPPSRSAAANP